MAQIHEALVRVMRAVGAVGKHGKNEQQGYAYRSIDDVMAALHPLLADAGIVLLRRDKSHEITERQSRGGGTLYLATLTTEWVFTAGDGSNESITATGQGIDSSDKALNKAAAASYKYALTAAFCIPTEDLAVLDADRETLEPAGEVLRPATLEQIQNIEGGIKVTKADREIFLGYFGIKRVEDISYENAVKAIAMLNRKADAQAREASNNEC